MPQANSGRKRADFSKQFSPFVENQQQTNAKSKTDRDRYGQRDVEKNGNGIEQHRNTFKCFLFRKSNRKAKTVGQTPLTAESTKLRQCRYDFLAVELLARDVDGNGDARRRKLRPNEKVYFTSRAW